MQHNHADDSWLNGSDERSAVTTKQLLTPSADLRRTVRDTFNPEETTASSALGSSPSGSYQLDAGAPRRPPRHEGLFRYVEVCQGACGGGEADTTRLCAPLASVCEAPYEGREEAQQIVHGHAAEGSLTETCGLTQRIPVDEELQAFSRKLQQALLAVKREAEDGFQTAKASVYRRLVQQLNVDREKELQRLEEARQEAEGARTLLRSLRKSKEATEERLSRMFIFVRRQILRQQARQRQQEALQRWRCFAMRRRRQRREQAFVTAANERSRVWRIFFPWRIAALETTSARRQQGAARQAQTTMENQVRLAQLERVEQEQVLQQLRQQLQAETATRLRLQENLCHIFLQGASAVYGSKNNECRGTESGNTSMCRMVHASNSTRQCTLNSTGTHTEVPGISRTAPSSARNQDLGRRGDDTSSKCAAVNISDTRAQKTSARIKAETTPKLRSLISQNAAATAQQQRANVSKTGTGTPAACNVIDTKSTSDGWAVQGGRRPSPCAPRGQSVLISNVRSQDIHTRPAGSRSLEVIGQMLAPHTISSSSSAEAAELAGAEIPASAMPLSRCDRMSRTWGHERWYEADTREKVLSHKCYTEILGKGEWHTSGYFRRQHSTANVRAVQPPALRRRRGHLALGGPKDVAEPSAASNARVAIYTSRGPCLNSSTAVGETITVSLPSDPDSVASVADEKLRVRTSKLPEAKGGNGKKVVPHYEGKVVAGHPRGTVTYPGGVEANQRNARVLLCAVNSHGPRDVDFNICRTSKVPHTFPSFPELGPDADMLRGKKDCSWVQSCLDS